MLHAPTASGEQLFSVDEVAQAAGVPVEEIWRLLRMGQAVAYGSHVTAEDAARLVRILRGLEPASATRVPLNQAPEAARRAGRGLVASGLLHVAGVALLLLMASLGLLSANDTEEVIKEREPVRLVYLMSPGPGGGGGGGGLRMPTPPPPAARKSVVKVARRSPPVPPVRRRATPPPPVPPRPPQPDPPRPPTIQPLVVEPPKPPPAQTIKAPVVPDTSDLYEAIGMLSRRPAGPPSQGPGTGGGVGSGSGAGIGEGSGGGIGPGTGGGTGGGPFQPGSGIDPPTVVREVRPTYTDEARRRAIEGDVVLEIVVRRDGSVGNVRVQRTLGAGLEQKAIEAVRQWRFSPARRQGVAVDVVVNVSVEFKLR
jgi:TonB family protein